MADRGFSFSLFFFIFVLTLLAVVLTGLTIVFRSF